VIFPFWDKFTFSALTLFVGWQEWHHSCKTRATYYKGFISKHVKEKKRAETAIFMFIWKTDANLIVDHNF